MNGNQGPLSGVSVVEMTAHRAGPFCGALLADMGAEVVKIERPGAGDPARTQGVGPEGKSGYFMANNRNKRSVTLDLKSEAGVEAARSLLSAADVFVENFGYGVTDKLGIGYEDLREENPGIVYASIKGYGESGPYKEKPGLDLILQAEGGIMSVTGPEGGQPVKVGQAIGDLTTGMFAAMGVLTRLYERERMGERSDEFVGKFDVGLFDSIVTLMNEYLTEYSMDGSVPGPQGTSHQTLVPYQRFETSNGALVTGVPSDDRWDDFVELVGREELAEYPTNDDRQEHAEEVLEIIESEFETESTEHWLDSLTDYGFPCGPINDVEDVVEHEQTDARDLTIPHEDPDWGECLLPGHPIDFADYEPEIREPAPRLGEHTEEVFSEVAEDQTTLEEWTAGGAFGSD
ncbi:CaiB/BaiF CoA transferase family protein [Halalkalicoccus jeotgali]|uniref:Formyl-CoA transferase n=1 Tax=Halalkalicoccus jeotgali (strain DSM 18796 / CECT 7217 / JCM 14584 / KCTC 4019 / B3) TaxID=795797 RepID=D8J3N0_HALJB|nr:CoA transferase [Halalkalicoccus jeotgali]ADJ15337.1 Formyl-CoA transferase [Halalkalicoccus jeotgali B3]ELY35450.1 Formyl-CoA transferase [Halalkalicoccus jeotgali B3]